LFAPFYNITTFSGIGDYVITISHHVTLLELHVRLSGIY
jgi:hypothetical protein